MKLFRKWPKRFLFQFLKWGLQKTFFTIFITWHVLKDRSRKREQTVKVKKKSEDMLLTRLDGLSIDVRDSYKQAKDKCWQVRSSHFCQKIMTFGICAVTFARHVISSKVSAAFLNHARLTGAERRVLILHPRRESRESRLGSATSDLFWNDQLLEWQNHLVSKLFQSLTSAETVKQTSMPVITSNCIM